jgi:hypothetical protein
MLVCSSPKLIAAYHVLHRLSDPRHPPYALNCFKNLNRFYSGISPLILIYSLQLILFPNMSKNLIPISNLQYAEGNGFCR